MKKVLCVLAAAMLLFPGIPRPLHAGRECFQTPKNGPNLGVWRITNDPLVRDHANYHNTQCWSPDGRYLCYTHWGGADDGYGSKSTAEVHVYDVEQDQDRRVDQGINPRWARRHNWLFYVHFALQAGPPYEKGTEVMRLDLDTGKQSRLANGVEVLGETDADDTWLFGARRFRGQKPEYRTVRIAIGPPPALEELPEVTGSQLLPNPRHPLFFTREDHKDQPFGPTRYWFDLDGRHRRTGVPTVQQCHMSWLGNGEYLMLGNGPVRGRRWNEPYPSDVHFLASVSVGDVSPCGRSGRYVCGNSAVADLRSGDGERFIEPLSIICYPSKIEDNSDIYDPDPKGSPDGTKVCFVSNYDLKDGPLTFVTNKEVDKDGFLHVQSTGGFPESGSLVVQREVIGYARRTPTAFEGLIRRRYDTVEGGLRPEAPVTSFEARCLTDEQWKRLGTASRSMRFSIDDPNSPLIRQRQTDVYVVVIRRPDAPHLRLAGAEAQLIPGEEHYETCGYHLLRNGARVNDKPLAAGSTLTLGQPGEYQTVAVEWSGLESLPGPALRLAQATPLRVLAGPPTDFSWTQDRWSVAGRKVPPQAAAQADEAVREIVHLHDGVIHREWYRRGVIAQRHDLNRQGQATRRLTYEDGKLALREYFDREGRRVSQEIFAPDGHITESIRYQQVGETAVKSDHWWYDRGTPIRRLMKRGEEYVKQGDNWVRVEKK